MAYRIGECPDQCSGKGSNRQTDVGSSQLLQFPAAAQAKLLELGNPKRCTYCGCVYSGPRKIGIWDNGVLGPGWHSASYSKSWSKGKGPAVPTPRSTRLRR